MKKWLYTAALMGLTALSTAASAEGKFSVQVDGLQNGHFAQRHLLSEAYGGTAGFMGACPPKGQNHRYEITVTAVDVATLPNITADATPALVGFFANAHALGKAKVTVRQAR